MISMSTINPPINRCKNITCDLPAYAHKDFCEACLAKSSPLGILASKSQEKDLAKTYPKYYKEVEGLKYVDVYKVHQLFAIDDPSGAIQHASKKLLLSGIRTGKKSKYDDIREARDTLNRWLDLYTETT